MPMSRRTFLRGAAAAAVSPLVVRAQSVVDEGQLFRHGVASGDPLTDQVVLWTRVTAPPSRSARRGADLSAEASAKAAPIEVSWQIADDERLTRVLRRGTVAAAPERDFTVKIDAAGLEPGRTYFYAFEAGGQRSPTGRTKTLPGRGVERVRLAAVSCSNYGTGYFNVYRCLTRRDDLDAVLHLGDYIYESASGALGDSTTEGRFPQRREAAVTLADYRLRYAAYRSDVDLQDAHRQHPFIVVWDDHELADNAWSGGAASHLAGDGNWLTRQAAAYQAYLEWLPVRESTQSGIRLYRGFRIGDMADVLMLDTRGMRDRQLPASEVSRLDRPGRSLLGAQQEAWLFDQLRGSKRDGTRWRLIGQQVMFSSLNPPGAPVNADFWEGYPAARQRVIELLARENIGDIAILAGDIHSSWAFEVPENPWSTDRADRTPLAIELVTPAISSPPLFVEPGARERMTLLKSRTPHLAFLDGDRNGYVLLELTRDRLQADWRFVPAVTERSDRESQGAGFVCEHGSSRLTAT